MATTRVTRERIAAYCAYAWIAILSLALLGPALLPGFALSYDLVFTPRQDLLPTSLGVGGGLPRAVPQDAVVAMIETLVPGSWVEKAVLLCIPVLAGAGMLRLLGISTAGIVGATLAIANPFVIQRLVIGHWGFLIAYALLPWAIAVARRLRMDGDAWDGVRLVLLVALAGLTPSGAVLVALAAVPIALLPGSTVSPARRVAVGSAVAATWLPWLLPALLHPSGVGSDPGGAAVFALRGEGAGGPLLSALSGGGIWNADVVLASRSTALALLLAVLILGLAAVGARSLHRLLGPLAAGWWAGVSAVGLMAALASVVVPGLWGGLLDAVPGGGLARDAQKLLAPWVLLLAAAAGAGAGRLAARVLEPSVRVALAAALVVVPLACQPDALWGVGGRLSAVEYPAAWSGAREAISRDGRPGDVVSFPWTAFRRFDWNGGRTVLDPAPRWLTRPTVVADDLVVQTPDGPVVVSGDDPRSRLVGRAIADGQDLATALPTWGVGWALVAEGTPGPVPSLAGWEEVPVGPGLLLYAAPEGSVVPVEADIRLVAAVDSAVLAGFLALALALAIRRVRVRHRPTLVP